MRIELDPKKSIWENIAMYFGLAKKLKKKANATAREIEKTKAEIAKLGQSAVEKKKTSFKEKAQWFEGFRWFITSDGWLAIGGKNARQNRALVQRYFFDNDLFFHVEAFPGSVVLLKGGVSAPQRSLHETAQFAACYSDAWQAGFQVADAFCVKKEQVTLAPPGPYGKGFVITGKKDVFKNVTLALLVGVSAGKVIATPELVTAERFESCYLVYPGQSSKEKIARDLSKEYGHEDRLLGLIPGNCSIKKIK